MVRKFTGRDSQIINFGGCESSHLKMSRYLLSCVYERIEESLVNFHDHFIIQTTNEAVELCKAEAYKEALDVVEAALLEYECDELKILKEQVREEKSPLYKFKNDVVEAFKGYPHLEVEKL